MWTALMLAAAAVTGVAGTAQAQGVTTGAITGVVRDAAGAPLEGATVKLTNAGTGYARTATTSAAGAFRFGSLEVGTGYAIRATAIGFRPGSAVDLRANLGGTNTVNFSLEKQTIQLEEIITTALLTAGEINPSRMGPQTVISDSLVARLPTLGRQLTDFVRLSPNVVTNPANRGSISAAGQNNRFNNIQVDGTTQTDRFGLGASGELGGQADGRGISLEAVKEYQVLISPFNVTQGNFTGALINAVTKNGTNDYTGSAFFTYRDQSFGANVPAIRATPFNVAQFGGSVGGPIVRDKLFFFLAGELQRSTRPAGGPFLGGASAIAPPVTQAQVDRFNTILTNYGITGGSGLAVSNENPIANIVGRLDWQASDKTRLVFRNIFNDSKGDDFGRGGVVFNLTSNAFRRSEWSNSSTLQVLTNTANGGSNEFQLGWTRQRFKRSLDQRVPQISVQVPSATSSTQATLRAGADQFSQGNELDQDLIELRNDYTFPISQRTQSHLVTIGTRNEFYQVRNSFLQSSFGVFNFLSLDSLANGQPNQYTVGRAREGDGQARFKGASFAAYIQDQWSPTANFNMTVGFRAELPVFFDRPTTRTEVFSDVGRNTGAIPSYNPQLQPRLGFNWDVSGNQTTQVRGGVGVFAGNPAYVWLSNLFQNNGLGYATFNCNGIAGSATAPPAFTPGSVSAPPTQCAGGASLASTVGSVNTADPGLRLPQVMRASLGLDRTLVYGIVGTFDALYTRGLSNLFYQKINLRGPQGVGLGGRVLYGTLSQGATGGIPSPAVVNTTYGTVGANAGIYDIQNQGGDYSYSVSATLRKRFRSSWEATAGYTYGRSYSVVDLASSTANSNWNFGRVYSGLQGDKSSGISNFDVPHRIVGSVSYTAPWKSFPTDVTVFYQGQSGTPYAYTYRGEGNRGDQNADGFNGNDPIYIPQDANNAAEIQFSPVTGGATAADQAAAFNALIAGTPCLAAQRGSIMKRNSCRNGFFHQLDLSVRQGLPALGGQRISLQAEVYNFLNLINSDWGKAPFANSDQLAPVTNPNVSLVQAVGQAGNVPIVRYNAGLTADNRLQNLQGAGAFWQAQFTVRYAF